MEIYLNKEFFFALIFSTQFGVQCLLASDLTKCGISLDDNTDTCTRVYPLIKIKNHSFFELTQSAIDNNKKILPKNVKKQIFAIKPKFGAIFAKANDKDTSLYIIEQQNYWKSKPGENLNWGIVSINFSSDPSRFTIKRYEMNSIGLAPQQMKWFNGFLVYLDWHDHNIYYFNTNNHNRDILLDRKVRLQGPSNNGVIAVDSKFNLWTADNGIIYCYNGYSGQEITRSNIYSTIKYSKNDSRLGYLGGLEIMSDVSDNEYLICLEETRGYQGLHKLKINKSTLQLSYEKSVRLSELIPDDDYFTTLGNITDHSMQLIKIDDQKLLIRYKRNIITLDIELHVRSQFNFGCITNYRMTNVEYLSHIPGTDLILLTEYVLSEHRGYICIELPKFK
jgi:hypothetical protein